MLSNKQILFRDYLIRKLGFLEDDFLIDYVKDLEISAPKFRYLGALPAIFEVIEGKLDLEGNPISHLKGRDDFKEYERKHDLFVPKNYNIIDFLNQEFKIKKSGNLSIKGESMPFISASDLSNFTYCPVSFSISKTFNILKIETAYLGTELHEEQRLIKIIQRNITEKSLGSSEKSELIQNHFIDSGNKYFFEDISKSRIIYNGHDKTNEKKYFKSVNGDYVGQPDYIFLNAKNIFFVVEEKFQFESEKSYINDNQKFYPNHVNQLLSYIYGISDYSISYGYLVYWKFNFDWERKPQIHSCYIYKINKSEKARSRIILVYKAVKNFMASKILDFEVRNRNPSKCANCVSNLVCGHKTGRFNTVSFPYSPAYLKTYFARFPEELKKSHLPDDQNSKQYYLLLIGEQVCKASD